MDNIFLTTKVIWAQLDANMHLRHSAYADLAAQARIDMLVQKELAKELSEELKIGPILFREELTYLKEVRAGGVVHVSCQLSKCRADGSRYSILQNIYRDDGVKAAIVQVDGAWIDMDKRKLAVLPQHIVDVFMQLPRTDDFVMLEDSK